MMDLPKRALQWSRRLVPGSMAGGFILSSVVVFVGGRRRGDANFGSVLQSDAAAGDHLFACLQPLTICTLSGSRTPISTFFSCARESAAHHHHLYAAFIGRKQRRSWNDNGIGDCFGKDGDTDRSAGLQFLTWVVGFHPNFHGGAVRIDCRTDHRDFAVQLDAGFRLRDGSCVSNLQRSSLQRPARWRARSRLRHSPR